MLRVGLTLISNARFKFVGENRKFARDRLLINRQPKHA